MPITTSLIEEEYTHCSWPEIVKMDALTLSDMIRNRSVSCLEVMSAYIEHIDVVNPMVNAIVSLQDADRLLELAEERDFQLERGEYRGWLHGIPQAVKDLSPTAGITTTYGSPLYRRNIPEKDGLMASRLKRDGAIIIGKTNTPEFGLGSHTYNPVFGATRNAYDYRLTAGGSSGGSAVAVAMRMLPVADGSDMMGSLRNPAAYNNIFGLRPSFGRVPYATSPDLFGQQLSTDGPMGRTVRDIARLLATQAGADDHTPLSLQDYPGMFCNDLARDFKGTRIGWIGDWNGYLPMENGILPLCEKALGTFRDLGCEVDQLIPDFNPYLLWECWRVLRHWSVAGKLAEAYQDPEKRVLLKPEAIWETEKGLALSALDVYRANVIRSHWFRKICDIFDRYDYIVLPTAQVFPFSVHIDWPKEIDGTSMDTYHRWMEVVIPGSLSGCPVMNVPAGFNFQGLPMGLQIMAPHKADLCLLQLAHAYEHACGDFIHRLPGESPI